LYPCEEGIDLAPIEPLPPIENALEMT